MRTSQPGFTLVEMVATLMIIGVLAAMAAPRFSERRGFDTRGAYHQVLSVLRYAQQDATAKRRYVCVVVAVDSVTLTGGATSACGTALRTPAGSAPFVQEMPDGVALSATNFHFDSQGKPSAGQAVTVTGDGVLTVTVVAETGYVY